MSFENSTQSVIQWCVDTGNLPCEGFSQTKRKNIVKGENSFEVLNYEKEENGLEVKTNFDRCRSVVCDPETKRILSFAPAQSIPFEDFKKRFIDLTQVQISEIMEGTMVNLFYDYRNEKWEIATKGNVGANYWYYRTEYADPEHGNYNIIPSQKTFRKMFLDAFDWTKDGDLLPNEDVNDVEFFGEFPKHCCYTFVLQHPENHIVETHHYAQVYLVAVHKLINRGLDGNMCEYVNGEWLNGNLPMVEVVFPDEYETWECFKMGSASPILFPKKILIKDYDELETNLKNRVLVGNDDWSAFPMGYMFLDLVNGERAHLENPVYVELKILRGNNPNLQFHYFSLVRAGKVDEFLKYFPMYLKQFNQFETQFTTFVKRVHQTYFMYYIKKCGMDMTKKYFIHASKIHHDIYLPSLKKDNKKIIINIGTVRDYFNSMSPQNIVYYLNYELR